MIERRQWNTVAITAVVVTVAYIGLAGVALVTDRMAWDTFSSAVLPVVTAWGGYLASFLQK